MLTDRPYLAYSEDGANWVPSLDIDFHLDDLESTQDDFDRTMYALSEGLVLRGEKYLHRLFNPLRQPDPLATLILGE